MNRSDPAMVQTFPPLEDSECETIDDKEVRMRASENLQSFLEDRDKSDILLEHLEALKASHRQQLEQIKLQHQAGLESRTLQNSLLYTNFNTPLKTNRPQGNLHSDEGNTKSRGSIYIPQRSSSTPDLSSKLSHHKPLNASGTLRSTMTHSQDPCRKTHLCAKEPKQVRVDKEELDWDECQKKFRVSPVPEHIFKLLYDDIVQEQERVRKEGRQQRKEFLLSIQKPFRFHQREETRGRRKPETSADKLSENKKDDEKRKCILKAVIDPAISEKLKEKEHQRKIRIQARAQETLRASSAPIQSLSTRGEHQVRSSQRTKTKVLAFLAQSPSFRPKTNAKVPDFDKLHQAFQKEVMERTERREVTLCQPFQLRTSALQPHRSRRSTDKSPKYTDTNILKRSNSFSGLTSLSRDTLPTYMTDAARKRSMAIRKSLELRESKEHQSAELMRQHRMNSQAMSRGVVARAKAMDPHRSLKEVFREKLKQHRQADQERVTDYKKELREMKARVSARPYLFEQVSQRNAMSDAERRYRSTLEQEGLDENFVRSTGETNESQSSENTDADGNSNIGDHNFETDTQHRERSGANSVRREDGTEDESVKTKGKGVS
ncbi:protein FAM161B isoform X1 [Ictalurus punctatus]|uniref:Protein FAM161B isoform X1 n=1 Tax=Ictalurus punctatus TaxID=7998 RepID=A0A9F7R928_ICTPU|nr:protein FAM161B isoform X1 [Ictalurus punctatus]